MTAQAADNLTRTGEPFCDNIKCNFHRVNVTTGCTGLEHGELKVGRSFFLKPGTLFKIKLCDTCAEVVPLFVKCNEEMEIDKPAIITPGAKPIMIVDSM